MIKAILFDLDGVLIDAADWHFHALNEALKHYKFPEISREDHLNRFNGKPTKVKLELLNIPQDMRGDIIAMKKEWLDSEIGFSCKPDPDKLELLFELRRNSYKIICCSNALRRSVFLMLGSSGLLPFFDLIVGNDDGYPPKPDPSIYKSTMFLYHLAPDNCTIIEDSPVGLEAARGSGATVIEAQYKEVNIELFKKHNLL